jgi:metallo-beta-lactamase class B
MNILLHAFFSLLFSFASAQGRAQENTFQPKELYRSKNLIITQLSGNTFQHISYKQTNDFGNVPCNGLIVRSNSESIVFDTPVNDETAAELINWIKATLHCNITAIIPTHFHDDCLGGLKAFHDHMIPSYAHDKTIELAKANHFTVPQNSFRDSVIVKVGTAHVTVTFFGEGHTKDNVVGYFSNEEVLFGGCLIKEVNATKGYLGDANLTEWSTTVAKIKAKYPGVKVVVPGHGKPGNEQLLDYTIQLFKQH